MPVPVQAAGYGKIGSAVVGEGEGVAGVFTTVDALTALHELLRMRE